MVSWRSRCTALALVFTLLPGAFEALENAVHLVVEGHLSHLTSDRDHEAPAGDEHGCNAVFHLCGCHATPTFVGPSPEPRVQLAQAIFASPVSLRLPLSGFSIPLDHPPRA